jgi:hypothetical protein
MVAHADLAKKHGELADGINILKTTSVQELVTRLSNVRVSPVNVEAEQKKLLEAEGGDFYKSVLDQYKRN